MADLITMLSAVGGQQGEEVDDDFNQTVLLLHGDGTNGAQNNTFLDSSTNNFTITRNGNTTQGTFSPFSVGAGEWSNFFDGSDHLLVGYNVALDITESEFTFEIWLYRTASGTQVEFVNQRAVSSGWLCRINTDNTVLFAYAGTGAQQVLSVSTLQNNTWTHLAVTRSGTTMRMFINGIEDVVSTTGTDGTPSIADLYISRTYNASSGYFTGYISNLRIIKGTALYTSNFTPPTAPLTAITNTSLLTCQSNRFVDNSTNAFAITRNGDVRVTPFSPFAPTAAYSAGTNGGSGYFDGSGDYLDAGNQTAYNFDGQFTVEAWVYRTVGSTNQAIAGKWALNNEAWLLLIGSGNTIIFYYEASNITTTATIPLNAWCHIAVTRDSSNDIRIFVDGVQTGSTTNSSVNITSTSSLTIGAYNSTGSITAYLTGYIAGLRVLKGTAQYTSNFTPPTAPLTAITNTSLLLNFTNAGIIDNTGKNNLETVGNAQIDTAVKKFGTGSLEFDGTGDWLLMPNTPDQQLGTGNFTIEFWVYLATGDTGSARGLVAKGTSTTGFLVSLDSSQKVVFTYTTSTITSSGAITTNAWNHIAVVREGTGSNQTKIYIGGTNDGTGTVSTDFNQTSVMYVGANRTGGDPMKGFIDDLRITKGVARYTANFSVPGKAFPDL